jgi:hypothetical protein
MDSELENLVKKIAETKSINTKIKDSQCINKHYDEIIDIVKTRSIKTLVEALNNSGVFISYPSMQLSLKREGKKRTNTKQPADQNPQNNISYQGKITESTQQKQVTINHEKQQEKPTETNDSGYKHLTLKQQAELDVAALGLDTKQKNPLLQRLLDKEKNKQ